MKLDDFVCYSILEYPTLFRDKNWENSRLLVLHHVFEVLGNGMEWHPDGHLCSWTLDKNDNWIWLNKDIRKTLPKNFFKMNLWCIDIDKKNVKSFKKELKGFFYKGKHRNSYVFEATEKQASRLVQKYDSDPLEIQKLLKYSPRPALLRDKNYRLLASLDGNKNDANIPLYTPYPLCELSPLVEMLNGKTNSPRCKNFSLDNLVKPDWVQGAVDIASSSLAFWKDSDVGVRYRVAQNTKITEEALSNLLNDWNEGIIKALYSNKSVNKNQKEMIFILTGIERES